MSFEARAPDDSDDSGLSPRARTALTLSALVVLLLAGLAWGWWALTAPLPPSASDQACVETEVEAGTKIYPDQVLVSVLNAGTRNGLAGRTMQQFIDAGFGEGERGNAPRDADVIRVQIWTSTPKHPAVRLVRSRLGDARIVDRETSAPGVVVVVGDKFDALVPGRKTTTPVSATTICSPPFV
ncbi:LytR C-terminal domain-containing protein [Nocardioides sp. zg-DK7169]|uniref:LytR C-terminal domain-containing protein n=1 Tax=Nocardioides sp. zg-DK7169 TaxID=2736600 RepID=UPI001556A536|nr:LytR C-terminal domain-containing protein [Nocardioides sp. zg-DK7169]NPC98197.1 LytR C-terminal domain-containing protein [Nocardioides sp. zg-DK7169]